MLLQTHDKECVTKDTLFFVFATELQKILLIFAGRNKKQNREKMKKTFKIEVDCANCANLVEQALKKQEGVKDVVVNFMTQKMKVDFEEDADVAAVTEKLRKEARRIEPDFEME